MNTRELLIYCTNALVVLRELQATNGTMTYGEFTRAIGMGEWQRRHRFELAKVQNTLDAVDHSANGERTIDWNCLRNAITGLPGKGMMRRNRVVRDPAPHPVVAEFARATVDLMLDN